MMYRLSAPRILHERSRPLICRQPHRLGHSWSFAPLNATRKWCNVTGRYKVDHLRSLQCAFTIGTQQAVHIRPMSTESGDLYALLGASPSASADELKKAYIGLARRYHPDRNANLNPDDLKVVHKKFANISAAFDVLGDPHKRQDYDRSLSQRRYKPGPTTSGYQYTYNNAPYGMNRRTMDEAYGFYSGKFTQEGESPYKIFSNTSIVLFAIAGMMVGIVVHIWRFSKSHGEVAAVLEERSRTAGAALNSAQSRARENGHMAQLEMLKDQHMKDSERRILAATILASETNGSE